MGHSVNNDMWVICLLFSSCLSNLVSSFESVIRDPDQNFGFTGPGPRVRESVTRGRCVLRLMSKQYCVLGGGLTKDGVIHQTSKTHYRLMF